MRPREDKTREVRRAFARGLQDALELPLKLLVALVRVAGVHEADWFLVSAMRRRVDGAAADGSFIHSSLTARLGRRVWATVFVMGTIRHGAGV